MAFIVVVRVLFLFPLYLTKIFCSLAARLLFFITIGCNSKFVSCQIPQLKTNQRRAQNKDERRQKKKFLPCFSSPIVNFLLFAQPFFFSFHIFRLLAPFFSLLSRCSPLFLLPRPPLKVYQINFFFLFFKTLIIRSVHQPPPDFLTRFYFSNKLFCCHHFFLPPTSTTITTTNPLVPEHTQYTLSPLTRHTYNSQKKKQTTRQCQT